MMKQRSLNSALVYSTEAGKICPTCGQRVADCLCKMESPIARGDGIARVRREVNGRGGKTVTVVSGILLPAPALNALATELKRSLGSGGSVKAGDLILQGDHRDAVIPFLEKRGFTVKRAGG